MTELKTSCYSCHGGCSAIATVEDGRVVKIRPDPTGPLNHGKMCPKGASGPQLLYHPEHLNYPLRRVGARGEGKWERIGWDEALDDICAHYMALRDAHGARSVAVLTGTGRHLKNQVARFANVLGTPNMASTGAAICFGPRVNAMMLTCGCYAVTDYYSGVWPDVVLLWGSNPVNSGPDGKMMWNVREAQKHGTRFIVIDPLPTELTRDCAQWLAIKPGTDGALALAILHELLETAGTTTISCIAGAGDWTSCASAARIGRWSARRRSRAFRPSRYASAWRFCMGPKRWGLTGAVPWSKRRTASALCGPWR